MKMIFKYFKIILILIFILTAVINASFTKIREIKNFNEVWKFHLGDLKNAQQPEFNDSQWRKLNLPHDWSIEGKFSKDNPAGVEGGALPGGIGWYRKTFSLPIAQKSKLVFIDFDGIYRNSKVWINGHFLGFRPYGYSSFRYELTTYLKYGNEKNVIAVRVDNSEQPNSRWYSGSGIYRNVWLVTTGKIFIDHWGTYITTPEINMQKAKVIVQTGIHNSSGADKKIILRTVLIDEDGITAAESKLKIDLPAGSNKDTVIMVHQEFSIVNPKLWSVEKPHLYKAVSTILSEDEALDDYQTTFGIRYFKFDSAEGFFLNGKHLKIKGVCNHHDLGCLGAAINTRAIERRLEILKEMGCNGIRTSHNPPAPELLSLCDKMGFIVMDEAFDMWKKSKTKYDYSLNWDKWHKRDLEDMVLRDRNHPSIFMWSIGNEVNEQWDHKDSTGTLIAKELAGIVRSLDSTRLITSNCNDVSPDNPVLKSGALDLIGFSYHQNEYSNFPEKFPGKTLIASETTSALETRGHYDMPSDSIRIWPKRWDLPNENRKPDNTCSAYDNCRTPWGTTHEEIWQLVKKYDFVSGMYIWTGFDYLGEPTPYVWPSRSSYFGIIDLAGFPKDIYYMYQSEWTNKPVLHVFPPWNNECWTSGKTKAKRKTVDSVDVWAYTNCDEVELFLNGKSLGTREKNKNALHFKQKTDGNQAHNIKPTALVWRIPYKPGTLKAIGMKDGKVILTVEDKTAGVPKKILLKPDRDTINADGNDLSFVTVEVQDKEGTIVPYAGNLIHFKITGQGTIAGVDNGSETSHEPFKANLPNGQSGFRKAFNGKCLVVVRANKNKGKIILEASSKELESSKVEIKTE